MSGPYCPTCDLQILHKDKLEQLLVLTFERRQPDMIGNEYLVMGTVDRSVWLRTLKEQVDPKTTLAQLHVFKGVVTFERPRWGWVPAESYKEGKA